MATPPSKGFISIHRIKGPPSPLTLVAEATRNKICQVLDEDAACRHPGVVDGLYGLNELAEFARLGHGVPTIRKQHPIMFNNRAKTDKEFSDRFNLAAPEFSDFNLKTHGLVLAGGAASSILMLSPRERSIMKHPYHDYDLFLVGHDSEAAALAAITALGDHLYIRWEGDVDVYRTAGCITFYNFETEVLIQVILRTYKTVGEVIHGFDLGSSAIAWDGERVFLTGLGKLAAECGANVLNLAARRSSYESRLSRYFERGFDVVLPNLNNNLPALDGRLPYLFAYGIKSKADCNCYLSAEFLCSTQPGWENNGYTRIKEEETSFYAIGTVEYGSLRALYKRNFHILASDMPVVEALCAYAMYTPGFDVRTINLDFDVMEFEQPEPRITMLESLVSQLIRTFNGAVKLDSLKNLLGVDRAAKLLFEILHKGKHSFTDVITKTCAERIHELKSHPHTIPFKFMTVEDGTALTGPFPRALVSLADWYGEAYRPTK